MFPKNRSQKGQSLILIALGLVGLLGLLALAVDGGMAYSDRRQAQNASDAGALYAAREYAQSLTATTGASQGQVRVQVATNGYTHDGVDTIVTLTTVPAVKKCPDEINKTGDGIDFTVTIHSTVRTSFAQVVGINQINNTVSATARGCKSMWVPLFWGNAVVGLDPYGTSFDSGSSSADQWALTDGGIFANSGAATKNASSVTFNPPGNCVTAIGGVSGSWSCTPSANNTNMQIQYTYNYMRSLFTYPTCPSAAQAVTINGQIHEASGYEGQGTNVSSWPGDYAPGVYCISNVDGIYHGAITGAGVTFYLKDPAMPSSGFSVKFNGGGYIGATAPTSGPYAGVLILGDPMGSDNPDSAIPNTGCKENFQFRGNGTALNTGTIYLPAACIDFRGNSTGMLERTQVIGYDVTSNGAANVAVQYSAADNHQILYNPSLKLLK